MTEHKIGFACVILDDFGEKLFIEKTTTKTSYLKKLDNSYLESLVVNNLVTLKNKINWLSVQYPMQRMMRISSNVLPLFTLPETQNFYSGEIKNFIETSFREIGEIARSFDIRLSSHPDQFTVINNPDEKIYNNSLNELLYHAHMFDCMRLDRTNKVAVNIHTGGRQAGTHGFIAGFKKLPDHVKKLLTVENCEFSYNVHDLVALKNHLPIVFDIHHHYINTGKILEYNDSVFEHVRESWNGIRPKIHYSVEPVELKNETLSKQRPHAKMPWCELRNNIVLRYLEWADIMVELKNKNLASKYLHDLFMTENCDK